MAAPTIDAPPPAPMPSRDAHGETIARRPTNRQWWKIAQELCRLLELEAPATRRDASDLIDRLAGASVSTSDDAPF